MYANPPSPSLVTRRRIVVSGACASLLAAAAATTLTLTSHSGEHGGRGGGDGEEGPVDLQDRIGRYTAGFPVHSGYRPPDRQERATLRGGVMDVLDGRLDAAGAGLARIGYDVRVLRLEAPKRSSRKLGSAGLKASGRTVAEIAERGRATGRGWGRVYVDLSRPVRWSVQVPHPRADMRSELMGAELFSRAPGAVLVLAGANRFAGPGDLADMAHQESSVFNAVCTALVERGMPGIQLHGFANESSPGHDVVLSPSLAHPGKEAHSVADLVEGSGLRTCRTWRQECGRLEGTKNVQGRAAAAHGLPFLHVENSRTVREDAALRSRVVDALRRVALTWTGG
jgi:hypothetical protein